MAVDASLLVPIGVISSLRQELGIPLPEDDGVLSLILVGMTALLSRVLVWQLGPAIADLFRVPALAAYLWLLPVGALVSGSGQVFDDWAVRIRQFTTIAIQTPEFPPGGMQRCENLTPCPGLLETPSLSQDLWVMPCP